MRSRSAMAAVAAALAAGTLPATAAAEETDCAGTLGAVTVDNLRVPESATCVLDGTRVKGTVKVERDATLRARAIDVVGNVQGENARRVSVEGSRLGGSFQVKQGGGADLSETRVTADVQLDANEGPAQRVAGNDVGGSVQVMANRGGIEISANVIDGNLQCKENVPEPVGGGNVVDGNAEDQCAGLTGVPAARGGDDEGAGRATLAARALRATRGRRVVRVPVRCAAGGPACAGTVKVSRGRAAAFRIAAGERRVVRAPLARRDRAALRRAGRMRVTVTLATRGSTVRRSALLRG